MAGTISTYYATTTTGLTSPSGLSVHGDGVGIVATTGGVTGTATWVLPSAIDETGLFRVCMLIEYNGSTTRSFTLQLLKSGGNFASGIRFRIINSLVSVDVGGTNVVNGSISGAFTSGNKYWCSIVGDGSKVTVSLHQFNETAIRLGALSAGDVAAYDIRVETTNYNLNRNSVDTWDQLDRISISTNDESTKILGFMVNQGGWEGSSVQTEVNSPGMIQPVIGANSDTNTMVSIPKSYTGAATSDFVMVAHPNANDFLYGALYSFVNLTALATVRTNYICGFVRGDPASLTAADSSEWGAPNGVAVRKALADYIRARLTTRRMYWLGQSMGAITGYGYERVYPGEITALASISGVANLAYAYDTEGGGSPNAFKAIIRLAYGVADDAAWQAIESTHDPIQNPSRFATLPIKIWFGSTDATLSMTKHATDFETAVDAAGGNVEIVDAGTVGHLATECYDGAAIVSFFQANTTDRSVASSGVGQRKRMLRPFLI